MNVHHERIGGAPERRIRHRNQRKHYMMIAQRSNVDVEHPARFPSVIDLVFQNNKQIYVTLRMSLISGLRSKQDHVPESIAV